MLKVGGLWVSPIDMEHVLMEHPRVLGVGVIGIPVDDTGRIAAFVECDGAPGAASPTSCASGAGTACGATSTRTSWSSWTSCRAR